VPSQDNIQTLKKEGVDLTAFFYVPEENKITGLSTPHFNCDEHVVKNTGNAVAK